MITLETKLLTDDNIFENIVVMFSKVYILSLWKDKYYMLIWDTLNKRSFGVNIVGEKLKKVPKILSTKQIMDIIHGDYFFLRDLVWPCKTEEELREYINCRLVLGNKANILQEMEI